MANVTYRTPAQAREWATHYIPFLLRLWEELPEIAAEIDTWDAGEALTYIVEWPLYEDQRAKLNGYAEQGVLTDEQMRQLERLNALADRHKLSLNRLFSASNTSKAW